MSSTVKALLAIVGGAILLLLLFAALTGGTMDGGMMRGMGSMMSGGMMSMNGSMIGGLLFVSLFLLLIWVLGLVTLGALGVWGIKKLSGR